MSVRQLGRWTPALDESEAGPGSYDLFWVNPPPELAQEEGEDDRVLVGFLYPHHLPSGSVRWEARAWSQEHLTNDCLSREKSFETEGEARAWVEHVLELAGYRLYDPNRDLEQAQDEISAWDRFVESE